MNEIKQTTGKMLRRRTDFVGKYLFIKAILLMLFLSISIFVICHSIMLDISPDDREKTSGVLYREQEEYNFSDALMTNDDTVSQYFRPQYTGLSEIRIRLAYSCAELPEENNTILRFSIMDENNDVLDVEDVRAGIITFGEYYGVNVESSLKKGKLYRLTMQQLGEDGAVRDVFYVPYVYRQEDGVSLKENIRCEHKGERQEYQWDLYYLYHCSEWEAFYEFAPVIMVIMCVWGGMFWLCMHGKKWLTILFLIFSPGACFVIVETITGNLGKLLSPYYAVNLVIYYLLGFLLALFCKNPKYAMAVMFSVLPGVGLVEYYVNRLRGRPFMLQDIGSFRTATTVMGNYTYGMERTVGAAMLATVAILSLIPFLPKAHYGKFLKSRKAFAILAAALLAQCVLNRDVMQNAEYFAFNMWDVDENYRDKGLICALLSEVQYISQKVPDGYSVERVERIAEKYEGDYKGESTYRAYHGEVTQPENIILIMNESWADLRYIGGFHKDETIMPYIDSMEENVIKGYLHMPVFGAGTANSEYEVLTGNSMQFLGAGDTAYQLYVSENESGMVANLKAQGYRAIALHPYYGYNWNRNNVYSNMGFDEFYCAENWPPSSEQGDVVRFFTSDRFCYETIINLEQNQKKDEKSFYFLVTMQNHGGYDIEGYEPTVSLGYGKKYPLTEQYLSLIQETDRAFEQLASYFEKVDKPTMIIMFGDHLPNIETDFYSKLYGMDSAEIDLADRQKMYATPFVIWANYKIEEETAEISSNYFGSYLLEKMGLQLAVYNKCLLQFMEEAPIIGTGMVMDADKNWYPADELPDNLNEIINQYQILQYNNVFGGRKKVKGVFDVDGH